MIESFIVTGNDWHKNSWTVDSENQNNNIFVIRTPKPPVANSDGLINCLLQPGLFYLRIQKSMREEFNPLIKSCGTRTDPATKTKSIGLQANARVVTVFALHLDSFIVT